MELHELKKLATEGRNPRSANIDKASPEEIVRIIGAEDKTVAESVEKAHGQIAKQIEAAAYALQNGGRLIYFGAGTSGRLGVIDAAECRPTYGVDDKTVIGLIAGGMGAMFSAVEGAEDSKELCVSDLKNIGLSDRDFVIGIAASGRTPYVIGGLDYARSIGAGTGCLCCNIDTEIAKHCDWPIELSAGPEVLIGSTRLKSGTCQKMVLNMISTATMIGAGKVYSNLMVDVRATNEKLVERCRRIVMEATGCEHDKADVVLKETNNSCKLAIVMILLNISKEEAEKRLEEAEGSVRKALKE